MSQAGWRQCQACPSPAPTFKKPADFTGHLRDSHCSQEGGSFVCLYGCNGVCASLPLEGVSDRDYVDHVIKNHVLQQNDEPRTTLGISGFRRPASGAEVGLPLPAATMPGLQIEPQWPQQPNVVADQHRWTVYNSTQNLPAVLNDPLRSKRESDFFTKAWGDSFTEQTPVTPCPFLPTITWMHFESYLKRTTRRYKLHLKRSNSLLRAEKDRPLGLLGISKAQWQDKAIPDIDSVPKIFMQPGFSLENVQTFNAVIPWSHLQLQKTGDTKSRSPHKSVKLLQEKLSHYLDIVEVQIARQISMRSQAFFQALTSHDALMDQLARTIRSVAELREKVHHLNNVLVKKPLQLMQLRRYQGNFVHVVNKLKLMSTVHQTQPTIQLLLSTSEFVGALDLIDTTQEILKQELAGIHSFRHLGSQLAEIQKVIDKMMHADFVRYVTADLNRPLTEESEIMEEERLVAIVFGMLRLRQYQFVDVFREEACTTVKATVKQTLIEIVSQVDDTDLDGTATSLKDRVRSMEFTRWLALLNSVFENLSHLLHRIQALHGVMKDALGIAAGKAHSLSSLSPVDETPEAVNVHVPIDSDIEVRVTPSDYEHLNGILSRLLFEVCDHAHECCAKLLVGRAKTGSLDRLTSLEFVDLASSIEVFSVACHNICGKRSTALRLALQSQANRFVSRFHDEKKMKLSMMLDSEPWSQVDIPAEFQDMVDHISATGSLSLPKMTTATKDTKPRKLKKYLTIDNQEFAVVGTALFLLKMVIEYCQCAHDISMVAADLLTRLLDLLKTFNSQTCQLILGAKALQKLGRRRISAKNLALASRCLQLTVYYIPLVRRHFEARLPDKQQFMCKHFDQILKDYKEHINEIATKLISITQEMLESELLKWEVKAPVPSPCFLAIFKQVKTFHETTSSLLPADQVQMLFRKIHVTFREKLRCHLQRLQVSIDGGPQHGLVTQDLSIYLSNLQNLNILRDLNLNDLLATSEDPSHGSGNTSEGARDIPTGSTAQTPRKSLVQET